MLLLRPDEPLFIHLPQDCDDLSAGWKCFQKLLVSPLGWVERTRGEKGFHNLPHLCQQRSEPETRFLVWQCAGISAELLQGRALWRGRAEKHEMEKQCCSVNIDRCSLHSRYLCCTAIPCTAAFRAVTLWTRTLLHLLAVQFKAGFCICSEKRRGKRDGRKLSTQGFLLKDNSTNVAPADCVEWGERFCQCWSVFISLVLIAHFGRRSRAECWMEGRLN